MILYHSLLCIFSLTSHSWILELLCCRKIGKDAWEGFFFPPGSNAHSYGKSLSKFRTQCLPPKPITLWYLALQPSSQVWCQTAERQFCKNVQPWGCVTDFSLGPAGVGQEGGLTLTLPVCNDFDPNIYETEVHVKALSPSFFWCHKVKAQANPGRYLTLPVSGESETGESSKLLGSQIPILCLVRVGGVGRERRGRGTGRERNIHFSKKHSIE